MLRLFLLTLIIWTGIWNVNAQTWQWGKRGGGSYNSIGSAYPESAASIAQDRNGNIYVLSPASFNYNDVNVAGNSVSGRGASDILFSSFTCDGTYRWSKVIGTNANDRGYALRADTIDGVYVVGLVDNWMRTAYWSTDTSVSNSAKRMFLVKYDTAGNYKWLRRPQPDTGAFWTASQVQGWIDMDVDGAGNTYSFGYLAKGLYGGSYAVLSAGWHILKYDRNGNFIGGIPIAITAPATNGYFLPYRMRRNPANGKFLVTGEYNAGGANTFFGTTQLTAAIILGCFDTSGAFDWVLQNKQYNGTLHGDPAFDASGDIYITGEVVNTDTFANVRMTNINNSVPYAFIIKLSSSGTALWCKTALGTGSGGFSVAPLSNGEVAVAGGWGGKVQWTTGGDSLVHGVNYGQDIFIARFNASTGAYIRMDSVVSSVNVNYFELPTEAIADKKGNLYIGGEMTYDLKFPGGTIYSQGGDRDFFVAKFGYNNCNCPVITSNFSFSTSVNTSQFTFTGNTASTDSVVWTFGDGQRQKVTSGFTTPVSHTYSSTGIYTVCATIYTGCGAPVQYCRQDTISCIPLSASYTAINSNKTVQLTYTGTTPSLDSLIWSFGDGQTQTVTSGYTSPITHTYATPAVYNICVTPSSYKCGSAVFCKPDTVTCPVPTSAFTANNSGSIAQFTYTGGTTNLDSLVWDFGDGGRQTVTSAFGTAVSHTYTTGGVYNVCAKGYGPCGSDEKCQKDTITATGVEGFGTSIGVQVYPNPATHTATLTITLQRPQSIRIVLTDMQGREVWTSAARLMSAKTEVMIPMGGFAAGQYFYRLSDDKGQKLASGSIIRK